MKIIVCFKVVTDYDKATLLEMKKGDFSYTKKDFGFFDEGALELAVSYKEENPDTFIEALTYGEKDDIAIEKLYSLNFNKVTVIKGKETTFEPKIIAKALGNYIKKNEFDLILTGEMAGPNDSGMLPYYLGKELEIPVISKVTHFTKDSIYNEDEACIYKNDICGKTLLVISNSKKPYLRFPKYKDIEEAKSKKEFLIDSSVSFSSVKISENVIPKKEARDIDVSTLLKKIREVSND